MGACTSKPKVETKAETIEVIDPRCPHLLAAAKNSDIDSLQKWIEAETPLDARNKDGKTALHLVAQPVYCSSEKSLRALIRAKAPLDLQDKQGLTALMVCCSVAYYSNESCQYQKVQSLLIAGANVHLKCNAGKTAFDYAVERGHPDIVKLLLEAQKKQPKPSVPSKAQPQENIQEEFEPSAPAKEYVQSNVQIGQPVLTQYDTTLSSSSKQTERPEDKVYGLKADCKIM